MKTESKVTNGNVILPITSTGEGKKLIFFNGVGSTQVIWKQVIGNLKGQYQIVTFDFRNHGNASASADHSFEAFLSDADSVMDAVGSGRPIVVAWSFGADLAVSYAASHPGVIGGLVIIDGAVPISEPLVEDEAAMRRSLDSLAMKFSMLLMQVTPYKYALSGNAIADIVIAADANRQQLLDVYAKVDCPITMVLATKTAGENNTEHVKRNNRLWREGGQRLAARYPSITVKWLDGGHRLPLAKPVDLAREIDAFARRTE
jgi:pimeloyl-ACP methyl ester carboxylesterase